jgi:hypothetical protein
LAFAKRDLTFLSVTDAPLPDGTWVSGSVSVQTDQWLPREAGYTRAFQDSIAFYKPLNGNTETDITIVCRIDLNDSGDEGQGGFIPMWVYVKMIGMTGAASIVNMRQALVEEKEARLARGEVQVPWWKKGGLRLDKILREQLEPIKRLDETRYRHEFSG